MSRERVNVSLTAETHQKLSELKSASESFDDIISKLIKVNAQVPQALILVDEIANLGRTRVDTPTQKRINNLISVLRTLLSL